MWDAPMSVGQLLPATIDEAQMCLPTGLLHCVLCVVCITVPTGVHHPQTGGTYVPLAELLPQTSSFLRAHLLCVCPCTSLCHPPLSLYPPAHPYVTLHVLILHTLHAPFLSQLGGTYVPVAELPPIPEPHGTDEEGKLVPLPNVEPVFLTGGSLCV